MVKLMISFAYWKKMLVAVCAVIIGTMLYSLVPAHLQLPGTGSAAWAADSGPVVTNLSYSLGEKNLTPTKRLHCYSLKTDCPVVEWGGFTYWVYGETNNSLYLTVAAFDDNKNLIAYRTYGKDSASDPGEGARYHYLTTVDAEAQTIILWGQGDNTITVPWSDLTALQVPMTETVLTISPNPVVHGDAALLTARVSSLDGTPVSTGVVTFKMGSADVGSMPLDAEGQASWVLTDTSVGSYSFIAEYSGGGSIYGTSSGSAVLTVNDSKRTISFDTNGGDPIASIEVSDGSVINDAYTTTRVGYQFNGWFSDAELDHAIVFPLTVVSDMTWYADWIDVTPPAAATLTADPTAPTNGNVTVTITYPEDAAVREYKVGAGAWQSYTGPVEVTDNGTIIYASSADAAGNESEESSYAVSNIDREAPAAATLTADPTAPTNGNVTVTITYPEDAAVREYKVGAGAWQSYTGPVEVTDNGTIIYASSTDAAGNESEQSSYVVSNIDREAPTAATLTADPTAPTSGNVTVTIVYPEDAAVREYKVGAGAWQSYTGPVEVTDNGTIIYASSTDAAGNESEQSSYVVSNIDREAPAAATLTADPTAPTNGNVTVTIVYPEDAAVREYKVGAGAWQLYTEPVEVTDNGTVHARSTDAAGNESEESSYVVSNIDREAPTAATLTADPTAPTSGNVTVTIVYPEDASVREYKVGAGAWQLYTEPVEVTDNGTVHARSTDAAGNE
ncbi:hypothetical protein E6C55_31450, partial [Cohnella fermenti]